AKKQSDEMISEAQHTRDEAEASSSDKREAADKQAASILKQATEEADELIHERREAAKSELEGVQRRIADLQT
ncbi:cell division protein, partial [Bifidobacterium pseudocatenulatum]|nr:cell division protein [Bifidobacterium pseudocatenulatum]